MIGKYNTVLVMKEWLNFLSLLNEISILLVLNRSKASVIEKFQISIYIKCKVHFIQGYSERVGVVKEFNFKEN